MVDIVDVGVVVEVDIVVELVNGVSGERKKSRVLVNHLQNFDFITFFISFQAQHVALRGLTRTELSNAGTLTNVDTNKRILAAHRVMHFI